MTFNRAATLETLQVRVMRFHPYLSYLLAGEQVADLILCGHSPPLKERLLCND